MVQNTATKEQVPSACSREAKWATRINDILIPAPRRHLRVSVLKAQAGIGNDSFLVRDHSSPNDVVLSDDEEIDLANGNVFYSIPRCDVREQSECTSPPKLALFVDDRVEITTNSDQSGASVRGLFGLSDETPLHRDFESPADDFIGTDAPVHFSDGPVFVTSRKTVRIVVNGRQRQVSEFELSFGEIVELAFDDPPQGEFICFTVTYRGGNCAKPEGSLVEGDSITITEGMIFNVTATDKS